MSSYVVDILRGILGESRKHNEGNGQIAFDCPACAVDKGMLYDTDGKGNLEVNYQKGLFRCWSCQNTNDMRGSIRKLILRYGTKENLKMYYLVKPDYNYGEDELIKEVKKVTELPKEFLKLAEYNSHQKGYNDALKYLNKRNIYWDIINKYNIGFINEGKFANRIIIPSYDSVGAVNYFIGRAYLGWVKPKYLNADTPKEDVIFNESLINPYSKIYLVEGSFDSMVLPNSIPLLGLYLMDNLYWYLQKNAKAGVVIILDGEAREDADIVYRQLNTLNLYNKVKLIHLREGLDTSLIYEKYGNAGLKQILGKTQQLDEMNY